MNKLVCILLLFFLSHSLANDSTKKSTLFSNFTLGLKAGFYLPITSTNYDFREDSDRKDPLISYFLGGILGVSGVYGIDNDFSIRTELQYSTFKFQIRKFGYFREDKINVTEELLEMPILFRKSFDKQSMNSPRSNTGISFGPVIGYNLTNLMNYSLNGDQVEYKDKLNNLNLDLCLAFDVTSEKYIVDLRFKYALLKSISESNNLIQSNEKSAYIKFHSIQLNVTYLLTEIF